MVVVALIYRSYTEYSATGIILIGTLYMLYSYLKNVGDTFYNFAEVYGSLIRINAGIETRSINKRQKKSLRTNSGILHEDT